MLDLNQHYGLLLGLNSPWHVESVEIVAHKSNPDQVVVRINHKTSASKRFHCPVCDQACPIADHTPERSWRHLDTMQFQTVIVARVPRTDCSTCGIKTVTVPWAAPHGRFTLLFEAFAILVIRRAKSHSAAAEILRCGTDVIDRIVEEAVERGIERRGDVVASRVGFDEKSWRRGRDGDSFITVLTDLDSRTILAIEKGKDSASAQKALEVIKSQHQNEIKAVAIDLSPTFTSFVSETLPDAVMVHDKFHVVQLANRTVDAVRRSEIKLTAGRRGNPMKRQRFKLLKRADKLDPQAWERLQAVFAVAKKTAKAYEFKESLASLLSSPLTTSAEEAAITLKEWTAKAKACTVTQVKTLGKSIEKSRVGILNYFKERISNAPTEGLNSQIQAIIADARGLGSVESLRRRILFKLGKLDLYPNGTPEWFWCH
jgi:transposase